MKQTITFNNKLTLSFPDTFHVMSGEDREALTFLAEGPGDCLSDPDRHMIISIGWKALGSFSSLLLSTKDVAKNMESRLKEPMRSYSFRVTDSAGKNVGREKAEGFSYEYNASGTDMYGESFVVKYEKVLYYLHFYTREKLKNENMKVWSELLASAQWA